MRGPLSIEITALAAAHIRQAESWWRDNRPAAPNAIREEVERVLAIIANQPRIGGRATNVRLEGVRRIHLPRIKYDLYFHLLQSAQRVEVVALWHSRRGKGPPI
jgi:plasmid stabilization system protein ParE